MLDADLAELYQVPTKRLNEQVRRNKKRFPPDFMFRLSKNEFENLRSQFATSRWGGERYAPYAFTEEGVAMLSGVLNSPRAIQVHIQIIRTFTKLRMILVDNKKLSERIDALEKKYDKHILKIFDVIKELMMHKNIEDENPKEKIGFRMR